MKQQLYIHKLTMSAIVILVMAIIIIVCSNHFGKENLFLLLNGDWGLIADYFWGIFTNAGDGLIWLIVAGFAIRKKKKALLQLAIMCFVFTTIFTQISKQLIIPDEKRPFAAIDNTMDIHTVKFIKPHTVSSFPSGHTATAFTIYLLLVLYYGNALWIVLGFLYALAVGYSRIYVAQHFPLDVAGGMIVSVCSVTLSLLVFQRKFNG